MPRIHTYPILALLAWVLVTSVSGWDLRAQWEEYKRMYGKSYGPKEDIYRYSIWKNNHALVHRHNLEHDMDQQSYRLSINPLADLVPDEFKGSPIGRDFLTSSYKATSALHAESPVSLPPEVDWRQKGCAGIVHNQGASSVSWAIVAADTIAGDICARTGKFVALSAQNLLDCCNMTVPSGEGVFDCIHKMGGIDTEASYPDTGQKGPCHFDPAHVGGTCKGTKEVPQGDELALQAAVATVGPVLVLVDASSPSFQLYTSGVYDDPSCSSTQLDHIMLVVGYGSNNGTEYWIVKNSWGTAWGMDGYILMARNKNNQCGIATQASYPDI